jgi:hypothetical protein
MWKMVESAESRPKLAPSKQKTKEAKIDFESPSLIYNETPLPAVDFTLHCVTQILGEDSGERKRDGLVREGEREREKERESERERERERKKEREREREKEREY